MAVLYTPISAEKVKPTKNEPTAKPTEGKSLAELTLAKDLKSSKPEAGWAIGKPTPWLGRITNPAVVTLVERKSRALVVFKVARSTAEMVSAGIIEALKHLPVKTITFDNGKEFAYHHKIALALGVETYFAKPYHSWERGTNENTNGLLRQYFPKGTDFGMVSEAEVLVVQRKLNTRPRKCLGFKTPLEVLHAVA